MTGLNYFIQSGIVKEKIHKNFVFKEKNIMLVMIFFLIQIFILTAILL